MPVTTVMPLQGAVPATYVGLLYDYLDARGADAEAVLGAPAPVAGTDALPRVAVTAWRDMLARAAAHLGDPLLGLHLGQSITPAHFGTLGYVFLACENLGAALLRLRSYQRLAYDVNPMRVLPQPSRIVLEWGQSSGRPGALVDETAITALVQLARDLTATRIRPLAVDFINRRPAAQTAYAAYFGCRVRFERPVTRVVLTAAVLDRPLRQPDPVLRSLLEDHAQALLRTLPERDALLQRTRQAIIRLAREKQPNLVQVAAQLQLSGRSLHRHLARHGTNFRRLRDDTLRRAAEDHLTDPRLQLADVALLLGYSEQSAFNRAFKRWTGQTPRAFRVQSGAAAQSPSR